MAHTQLPTTDKPFFRTSTLKKLKKIFPDRNDDELAIAMQENNHNVEAAVQSIMDGAHEWSKPIYKDHGTLSAEMLVKHDKKHAAHTIDKCFGCIACKFMFWQLVFEYKQVGKCKSCNTKYDPVPKENEFGYGHFECKCGAHWTNGKSLWKVAQICKSCSAKVYASSVGPWPANHGMKRNSRNQHQCEWCESGKCKHYFFPSKVHDSTGSTISMASFVKN